MTPKLIILILSCLEAGFCAAVLLTLIRSKTANKFRCFTGLLATRFLYNLVYLGLMGLTGPLLSAKLAYRIYFGVYWSSYATEAVLSLLVIYGIFRMAMAPLKGLADLGVLVFRWAGAISIATACAIAVIPHEFSMKFVIGMVTQLQQTSSVLTLCLLLFVCFAIHPLGLTFRSRIFGISLGLGISAATSLVEAAWIGHNPGIYATLNIISGVASIATLFVWAAYFTVPEPERKIIMVPTTSPYLKWNQISEVLGDEPGFVAVGSFNPAFLAPAEWEIMARASEKMAADSHALESFSASDASFHAAMQARSA